MLWHSNLATRLHFNWRQFNELWNTWPVFNHMHTCLVVFTFRMSNLEAVWFVCLVQIQIRDYEMFGTAWSFDMTEHEWVKSLTNWIRTMLLGRRPKIFHCHIFRSTKLALIASKRHQKKKKKKQTQLWPEYSTKYSLMGHSDIEFAFNTSGDKKLQQIGRCRYNKAKGKVTVPFGCLCPMWSEFFMCQKFVKDNRQSLLVASDSHWRFLLSPDQQDILKWSLVHDCPFPTTTTNSPLKTKISSIKPTDTNFTLDLKHGIFVQKNWNCFHLFRDFVFLLMLINHASNNSKPQTFSPFCPNHQSRQDFHYDHTNSKEK